MKECLLRSAGERRRLTGNRSARIQRHRSQPTPIPIDPSCLHNTLGIDSRALMLLPWLGRPQSNDAGSPSPQVLSWKYPSTNRAPRPACFAPQASSVRCSVCNRLLLLGQTIRSRGPFIGTKPYRIESNSNGLMRRPRAH